MKKQKHGGEQFKLKLKKYFSKCRNMVLGYVGSAGVNFIKIAGPFGGVPSFAKNHANVLRLVVFDG